MLLIGLVSVIVAAVLLASVFSGEGKEEPLELRPVGVTCLVGVERALLQAGRDDLEAGPVECPGGRGELRHHVRAVPPVLDHLDDAADLALRPPEPLEHAGHRLAVHVHAGSPGFAHPARNHYVARSYGVLLYPTGYQYWAGSGLRPCPAMLWSGAGDHVPRAGQRAVPSGVSSASAPASLRATSSAIGLSSGRPVSVTMTCGSSASTTVPSPTARTTMLQGSSSPMLRSMPRAWCANGGLQAPRIT